MASDPKADNEMELMRQELRKASSLEKHVRRYVAQEGDEQPLAKSYLWIHRTLEQMYEEYAAHLLALFAGGEISDYKQDAELYKEIYALPRPNKWRFADTSLKGLVEAGDKLASIFELFFSEDSYELPDHPEEIRLHLLALYAFYRHLCPADPPALLILRLTYIATKLAWAITAATGISARVGATKDRTTKGTAVKKSKKDEMKKMVIAELKEINTSGMSNHKIARTLHAHLGKKMQHPPCVDSIKRYLKEDGLI
jgi:hypothetical protein